MMYAMIERIDLTENNEIKLVRSIIEIVEQTKERTPSGWRNFYIDVNGKRYHENKIVCFGEKA